MLIDLIEKRIDKILADTKSARKKCSELTELTEYFSDDFLNNSHYVVSPAVPIPSVHDLGVADLISFSQIDPIGITYKDTYFVKKGWEKEAKLHCHELVHVAQRKMLGARPFMERYLEELLAYGYPELPLEKMAHDIDFMFETSDRPFDILSVLKQRL